MRIISFLLQEYINTSNQYVFNLVIRLWKRYESNYALKMFSRYLIRLECSSWFSSRKGFCVQALLAIHGRDWADLFYWSEEGGSRLAHIKWDPEYWALLYQVMADFWWRHVTPARIAFDHLGATEDEVRLRYAPRALHPYTPAVRALSKRILAAAPQRVFTAEQTRGPEAWAAVLRRREDALQQDRAAWEASGGRTAGGDGGDESEAGSGRDSPSASDVEASLDPLDAAEAAAAAVVAEAAAVAQAAAERAAGGGAGSRGGSASMDSASGGGASSASGEGAGGSEGGCDEGPASAGAAA
ncbi:MAG: hypothetical protein J3K34DRAFT_161534 [Monoraphidium minutum]|nr:MAG: hypothetical protein J3K34DRAFT_161534 [Monoraphidium minutum]